MTIAPRKEALKLEVISTLREQQSILQQAVKTAAEATTHADAKQEGKYDTRAIESSYLAGAQSERLMELSQRIQLLENLTCPPAKEGQAVIVTSLVYSKDESDNGHWHMILPGAAGITVLWEGQSITLLSPESVLGTEFLGKFPGDDVEITIERKTKYFSIESIL